MALLAPAGTPPAIVAKLNAATNAALATDVMKTALAKIGGQPRGGTPKDLADHLASETVKWKPVVEGLDLKPE
jgi:tripartite-type tricarboxylate transporter receptor subunit TctC